MNTRGTLPGSTTAFVGRVEEMKVLGALVEGYPLVTLTGPGGCGKTRLAIRIASEHSRAGGTFFADLSTVRTDDFVGGTVARALGLDAHPMAAIDVVARTMSERDALIVLDNCEQVVGGAARLCHRLVESAPAVRVVATSRERLAVPGEVVYSVPPLSCPPDDDDPSNAERYDAVRLFMERAQRARPGFIASARDVEAIVRICTQLDGMPLGIELAAACLPAMSPGRIADGLSERFRLLHDGPRTVTPRLRSLRASVDWSHDLLSGEERTVFRRLSVFVDPFDLATAQAVVSGEDVEPGDVLGVVTRLVHKSLVVADPDRDRYHLLRTLRDYAHDQLLAAGELDAMRVRHRDAFVGLVASLCHVPWRGETERTQALVPVADDVLLAFRYSEERDDADAMCVLCSPLMQVLRGIHRTETMQVARRVADALPRATPRRRAELVASWALWWEGWHPHLPVETARQAADLFRSTGDRGSLALAHIAAVKAGDEESDARATDALEIANALDDPVLQTSALWALASVLELDDGPATTSHLRRAVPIAYRERPALGHMAQWNLIKAHDRHGHHRAALAEIRSVLDGPNEGGSIRWRATAQRALSRAHVEGPKAAAEDAESYLRMQKSRTTPMSMRPDLLDCLTVHIHAVALHLGGDLEAALRRYEEARSGLAAAPEAHHAFRSIMVWQLWCRAGLGDDDGAHRAAVLLRERPFGGPAEIDLTLLAGALAARRRGETAVSQTLAHELLPAADRARRDDVVATLLELIGGDARLVGAAHALREATGAVLRLPPHDEWYREDVDALRGALGDEPFGSAWEEGATFDAAAAVAWARRGRGARGRPSTGWASLTPAELSVVELVAGGLSNQEIADRLFVSPRTVASHLRRVFAKVGVRSRTELARLALSAG